MACYKQGRITSTSAKVFMEDSERAADLARVYRIDSGLLQAMRDNAQPLAEILTLLAPLTGELIPRLHDLPVEELREEMDEWRTLYAKLKAALADLLSTVARLHESGMLARLPTRQRSMGLVVPAPRDREVGLEPDKWSRTMSKQARPVGIPSM